MSYSYHEPETVDEAVELLGRHGEGAMLLAGGTSFTILSRFGLVHPSHVIGLRRVPDLRGIIASDDRVWIGATTNHREIETSAEIRSRFPALAHAFARIATPRIRLQATIGGNLAHADPAQDPPPALIAHDAIAHVAGPEGYRRKVGLDELFTDYFSTVLRPQEILTGISVPTLAPGTKAVYLKYTPRSADDYATVAVAGTMRRDDDGVVSSVRLALGGVGPVPYRPRSVEAALVGVVPTQAAIEEACSLVADEVAPLDDARGTAAYKRKMAVVWLTRAVNRLMAG